MLIFLTSSPQHQFRTDLDSTRLFFPFVSYTVSRKFSRGSIFVWHFHNLIMGFSFDGCWKGSTGTGAILHSFLAFSRRSCPVLGFKCHRETDTVMIHIGPENYIIEYRPFSIIFKRALFHEVDFSFPELTRTEFGRNPPFLICAGTRSTRHIHFVHEFVCRKKINYN